MGQVGRWNKSDLCHSKTGPCVLIPSGARGTRVRRYGAGQNFGVSHVRSRKPGNDPTALFIDTGTRLDDKRG